MADTTITKVDGRHSPKGDTGVAIVHTSRAAWPANTAISASSAAE